MNWQKWLQEFRKQRGHFYGRGASRRQGLPEIREGKTDSLNCAITFKRLRRSSFGMTIAKNEISGLPFLQEDGGGCLPCLPGLPVTAATLCCCSSKG
ncbi:hypothetical protein Y1Q_0012196 [Alligator mississippiensis]|uniref:Uncharacterized protein n=1 Tax=Alligator mississippiensis TaxID=8496 RepID=A0A151N5D9_ALLMI|nr:hypothetical protein Y1Q_0012196 [Alligator mississippiensis]